MTPTKRLPVDAKWPFRPWLRRILLFRGLDDARWRSLLDQQPVVERPQLAELIMPAPTVTPVASSIRMNEPVVRFLE